jgi:hypothetical protein
VAKGTRLAIQVPSEPLSEIDALFRRQGIEEWTVKSKGGQKTISGRTASSGAVHLSIYTSTGLSQTYVVDLRQPISGKA